MTDSQLLGRWSIHRRWRWIGIVLFCLAAPGPLVALTSIFLKGASWKLVFLSIGTLGLSLGSFGTANDTAVHALRELANRGAPIPDAHELASERERRPARLAALHDSPKAAFIMPIVVIGLFAWQISIYMRTWFPAS